MIVIKGHIFIYTELFDHYTCDACGAFLIVEAGGLWFAPDLDSYFQEEILTCGENIMKNVLE